MKKLLANPHKNTNIYSIYISDILEIISGNILGWTSNIFTHSFRQKQLQLTKPSKRKPNDFANFTPPFPPLQPFRSKTKPKHRILGSREPTRDDKGYGSPSREPIFLRKDFLHKQVVEGLGYVPGVCWSFLRFFLLWNKMGDIGKYIWNMSPMSPNRRFGKMVKWHVVGGMPDRQIILHWVCPHVTSQTLLRWMPLMPRNDPEMRTHLCQKKLPFSLKIYFTPLVALLQFTNPSKFTKTLRQVRWYSRTHFSKVGTSKFLFNTDGSDHWIIFRCVRKAVILCVSQHRCFAAIVWCVLLGALDKSFCSCRTAFHLHVVFFFVDVLAALITQMVFFGWMPWPIGCVILHYICFCIFLPLHFLAPFAFLETLSSSWFRGLIVPARHGVSSTVFHDLPDGRNPVWGRSTPAEKILAIFFFSALQTKDFFHIFHY